MLGCRLADHCTCPDAAAAIVCTNRYDKRRSSDTADNHIGWAVYQLKAGKRVRRRAWLGRYWIELGGVRMAGTVRGLILVSGRDETYSATQADLLATDWELA